jgi:hypothetical protein
MNEVEMLICDHQRWLAVDSNRYSAEKPVNHVKSCLELKLRLLQRRCFMVAHCQAYGCIKWS